MADPTLPEITPSVSAMLYQRPRLTRFGELETLTKNVGMNSTLADKTGGGNNKTR